MTLALKFTMIDAGSRGIQALRSRVLSLAKDAKHVERSFNQMTEGLRKGGKGLLAAYELKRGLAPAVGVASDLQASTIRLKTELYESGKAGRLMGKELGEARKTAFAVQAKTPFDMTQVIDTITRLKKSGAQFQDVIGEYGAAAAASYLAALEKGLDPATAGKTLIQIGTPFEVAANQYMDLADTLTRVSSAATTDAVALGEGFSYAAGPAAQMGSSIESTALALALMSKYGRDSTRAGTAYTQFLYGLTGKTPQAKKAIAALNREFGNQLQFFDERGKMRHIVDIAERLRATIGQIESVPRRTNILRKIFGEEGVPVAMALLSEGKNSIEAIEEASKKAMPIQQRMAEVMEGYGKSLDALKGTSTSTIAALFTPALNPLKKLVDGTSKLVENIGKLSMEEESVLPEITTGAAGLALGGLTAYGIYHLAKGGRGALGVLKGVGGIRGLLTGRGGVAAGIATGKALEKAAGVTPVFVTNWPSGMTTGGGPAEAATTTGIGYWLGKKGAALKGALPGLLAAAGRTAPWVALAGAYSWGAYKIGEIFAHKASEDLSRYEQPGFLQTALGTPSAPAGEWTPEVNLKLAIAVHNDGRTEVTENQGVNSIDMENRRRGFQ